MVVDTSKFKKSLSYERNPNKIYANSFSTVRREGKIERFDLSIQPLVTRIIHACGMIEVADRLSFSENIGRKGFEALSNGSTVICDCEMVASGIIRRNLPAENDVVVTINDLLVPERAKLIKNTRSAAAVELWEPFIKDSVVAIGNAPTALFHLLELIDLGFPRPACILGFPVGFVGAAESKAELTNDSRDCEYITLRGRRGGSAMAAAAVNALAAGLPEEIV
jgi:precorrin-8X/cobalt-precorrin-8 methylmutase